MGLKDSLKGNPVEKVKELATEAREQAGEAGAKARAKSGAGVQASKGDASFSAGAGAGADSGADTGRQDDDQLERLERLAALHESGAISDEEFAAAKRKLLDA